MFNKRPVKRDKVDKAVKEILMVHGNRPMKSRELVKIMCMEYNLGKCFSLYPRSLSCYLRSKDWIGYIKDGKEPASFYLKDV